MKSILIIDNNHEFRGTIQRYFARNGFHTFGKANGKEATEWLKSNTPNLVICTSELPDYTAMNMLQKIKIIHPGIPVVIISDNAEVRLAVEIIKEGAYDYLPKPLQPENILNVAQNAIEKSEQETPAGAGRAKVSRRELEFVEGRSPQSQLVRKHIDLIAETDMSVIISGETGTGKEYVAKAIHHKSKRADKPFVALDCGALPRELASSELFGHVKGAFTGAVAEKKGSFELAHGGTLFLDEIGNLDYENQVKLLRVLQERVVKKIGGASDIPVDVRMLVAINKNLKELVESGHFREDIYHRLNEFKIELAPLRERKDDIELFANHFLLLANRQLEKNVENFDDGVMERLRSYPWHGNLRELKNVVKRAVLLSKDRKITINCLPPEIANTKSPDTDLLTDLHFGNMQNISLKAVVENAEQEAINKVMKHTNNNKTKTASLLKIHRKTLYNKLKN